MSTKNPRIHVTFEKETAGLVAYLAHQEHKSISCVVSELTSEALELREDLQLSKLAGKLDKEKVKTYSHKDAWK